MDGLWRGPSSGLQMAIFSLDPQDGGDERALRGLFHKGTSPIHECSSLLPNHPPQRPHLLISSCCKLGFQHVHFGEHKHSVQNTPYFCFPVSLTPIQTSEPTVSSRETSWTTSAHCILSSSYWLIWPPSILICATKNIHVIQN